MSGEPRLTKIVSALLPSWRGRKIAACDERMASAKLAFSKAALSCLRGAADAQEQVRSALAAVDAARSELAALSDAEVDALAGADVSKLNRNP